MIRASGFFSGVLRRVVTPVHCAALFCGVMLCSCMTFQPFHRREIQFTINASHDQFQLATKNASERLGGTIIERAISTPKSAELVDTSRREQSSVYIGFMTPTTGPILDSINLMSIGSDSGTVTMKSFYPLIAGSAIMEELNYPRTMTGVSERRVAPTAMSLKSKILFDALTMASPALANTYLMIGNPFAGDSPELTSIFFPLAVDAGLAYFAIAEKGKTAKPGLAVVGVAAVFMRLSGILGLSGEIDRYNTVVRSGYNLDLTDIAFFKTQLNLNVIIP